MNMKGARRKTPTTDVLGLTNTTDAKTMALIADIKRRKAEIQDAEQGRWKTNRTPCVSMVVGGSGNLAVETDVATLIRTAGFLQDLALSYANAAMTLKVDSPPKFLWQGYSLEDWLHDIKLRISKLQLEAKRKKLEELETRLNAVISPELRAQMELDDIEASLAAE